MAGSWIKVADLSPKNIFGNKAATDGTKLDLKIGVSPGFGGLDFSGQIYNPVNESMYFLFSKQMGDKNTASYVRKYQRLHGGLNV